MGGLGVHQCECFVPNILGKGGQIFETPRTHSEVFVIRFALHSGTRYSEYSNIRSNIYTCIHCLKGCSENAQRQNECHTQCHTLAHVGTQIRVLLFDSFLSHLSMTASTGCKQRRTLKKKFGETKKVFSARSGIRSHLLFSKAPILFGSKIRYSKFALNGRLATSMHFSHCHFNTLQGTERSTTATKRAGDLANVAGLKF